MPPLGCQAQVIFFRYQIGARTNNLTAIVLLRPRTPRERPFISGEAVQLLTSATTHLASPLKRRASSSGEPTWTVVDRGTPYSVSIRDQLFTSDRGVEETFDFDSSTRRRILIIDDAVDAIYGPRIRARFSTRGRDAVAITIPGREASKSVEQALYVIQLLDDIKLYRRTEPLIAIGGGAVGDLVGFVASVYRRGVPYLRIPTTLLAMVDAGIGVKTGINTGVGKNRIGTYYAPTSVLVDMSLLHTLPNRQIASGFAEMVKLAVVRDAELFALLEQCALSDFSGQSEKGKRAVEFSIDGMLEELAPNLLERTLERRVDFGHSFSPSLELWAGSELLHGEAVSIDIALSSAIAHCRRLISSDDMFRILRLLQSVGLPVQPSPASTDLLWAALCDTTRHRDGRQRLPLPIQIGAVQFFDDVSFDEIGRALQLLAENFTSMASTENETF